jgi:hypothetical protein
MPAFYTMESVRDQIKGTYTVRPIDMPDNWNRYPCPIEKRCEAKGTLSCKSYVEIDINQPNFSTALLEILFFRPRRMAFIREDNRQLRKLIALNVIDQARLVPAV